MRLLEWMYSYPVITVSSAQRQLGLTFQATNTIVQRFVEMGILVEITGSARSRAFMYESYYRLFEPAP